MTKNSCLKIVRLISCGNITAKPVKYIVHCVEESFVIMIKGFFFLTTSTVKKINHILGLHLLAYMCMPKIFAFITAKEYLKTDDNMLLKSTDVLHLSCFNMSSGTACTNR